MGRSVTMEKPSWVCTLTTQLSLCFLLYLALNLGYPYKSIYRNRTERKPIDIYFISVRGGFRPLKEQTHLLKQMVKVVKTYKVLFVVDIGELGEDDPLMQNATWYFHSLKVPWYTTTALKGQEVDYFVKRIKIPYGKTLDIIALDTGSLQDSSSDNGSDQLHWLTRTLESSDSNWRVVVGLHPLVDCHENTEQMDGKRFFGPLHHIFLKYGVNAYLSGQACANYIPREGTAHTGSADPVEKGPYFTTINRELVLYTERVNGFLLHRVSPLEMETYIVTLTGEVVHKISLQQKGRDVM